MKQMRALLLVVVVVSAGLPVGMPTAQAGDHVVTNTSDSGPGSLRQAIISANNNPGPDTIKFNTPSQIPATRRPTVSGASSLPAASTG